MSKLICNCEEALRESPCPIHDEGGDGYPEPPTPIVTVIKVADRVEPFKKSNWQGFAFKCSNCEENSIMHWGEQSFNFCPNCGCKLSYEWEGNKQQVTTLPTATE